MNDKLPLRRWLSPFLWLMLGTLLVIGVPLLYGGSKYWQLSELQNAYASVQEGDSLADVVSKMGRPARAVSGKLSFNPFQFDNPYGQHLITERSQEYVRYYMYRVETVYLSTTAYIGFDAEDRVVLKVWMDH